MYLKTAVAALGGLIMALPCAAQQEAPYALLDFSEISTGLFLSPELESEALPDGETPWMADFVQSRQVQFAMAKAQINNSTTLPNLKVLREAFKSQKSAMNVTPLTLHDLTYYTFVEDAEASGLLAFDGENYVDLTDETESPFEANDVFSLFVDLQKYSAQDHLFLLSETMHFFSDEEGGILEIDFDDGLGLRDLAYNTPLAVHYDDTSVDRNIVIKCTKTDGVKVGGFQLKAIADVCEFGYPGTPPWSEEIDVTGGTWSLSTFAQSGSGVVSVGGNAYTLLSDDGIFDKPFIFVEGVDFTHDVQPRRFGNFGWCAFVGEDPEDYPMLSMMPELLNPLREMGYDIVMVDFEEGSTYINHNAMLVVKVIQLCNAYKEGDAPLIIAGASMGGQVSRWALRYMELNRELTGPHCAGLWVSLDSPHSGATIPLGQQYTIEHMANFNASAENFYDDYLSSPAARQMLIAQLPSVFSLHDSYYSALNGMGFPEKSRNVAIANGNLDGVGLGFSFAQSLLHYDCEFWPFGSVFQVSFNESPDPQTNILAHTIKQTGLSNTLEFPVVVNYELPRYDNAPGGMRTSVLELVNEINAVLPYSNLPAGCGQSIQSFEFEPNHCFIPSVSALAMPVDELYLHIGDDLALNPNLTPFDAVMGGGSMDGYNNEYHSQVTAENIAFILEQIALLTNPLPPTLTELSTNSGLFNFKRLEHRTLYDVTVKDGGTITVNSGELSAFADDPNEVLLNGTHIRLNTYDCGAQVVIGNNGLLEIGDPSVGNTAHVVINPTSTLTVESGGEIRVQAGSALVLEDNSKLILKAGSTLILEDDAQLLIKEGAQLKIYGQPFVGLYGASARIDLYGTIELGVSGKLAFQHAGYTSGKLKVYSSGMNIFGSQNAKLLITGDGPTDKIIELMPGADLWPENGFGEINIDHGLVYFHEGSRLNATCPVVANHSTFYTDIDDTSDGIHVWRGNLFDHCVFDNSAIQAYLYSSKLKLQTCDFQNGAAGAHIHSRGFTVTNCNFSDCAGLKGSHLSLASEVLNSTFTNADHNMDHAALVDNSNITLLVSRSTFSTNFNGIVKTGGELQLLCNTLIESEVAVHVGTYAYLNMTTLQQAGYNVLQDNEVNVELDKALGFGILHGHNTIKDADWNIKGTIIGTCSGCNPITINAARNTWNNADAEVNGAPAPEGPDPASIDLHYYDPNYAFCDQWNPGCELNLHDPDPQPISACRKPFDRDKGGKKDGDDGDGEGAGLDDENNPLLFTEHYDGISLDVALAMATHQLEWWNVAGNDELAVDRLHEIVTSGLDLANTVIRDKVWVALGDMKIGVENQFAQNELQTANNLYQFQPSVQNYVDVLNIMTIAVIPEEFYADQFYLEVHKSQLCRTLKQFANAQEIVENSDDCMVDALEQSVVNQWLDMTQADLQLSMFIDSIPDIDSILIDIDKSGYNPEVDFFLENYYFGAIIMGPGDFGFMPCQNFQVLSYDVIAEPEAVVYPNPASGQLFIVNTSAKNHLNVRIYSNSNQLIVSRQLNFEEGQTEQLELGDLAPGLYVVELEMVEGIVRKKILIF
jgi:hypothetical protein